MLLVKFFIYLSYQIYYDFVINSLEITFVNLFFFWDEPDGGIIFIQNVALNFII